MARLYYIKDGTYPQNLVDPFGRRIALAELHAAGNAAANCGDTTAAGRAATVSAPIPRSLAGASRFRRNIAVTTSGP